MDDPAVVSLFDAGIAFRPRRTKESKQKKKKIHHTVIESGATTRVRDDSSPLFLP